MTSFFQWLAEVGFRADIQWLRTSYPEIGWQSLEQWAAARDWAGPAVSAESPPGRGQAITG